MRDSNENVVLGNLFDLLSDLRLHVITDSNLSAIVVIHLVHVVAQNSNSALYIFSITLLLP